MGLYEYWDALSAECDEFHAYAHDRLGEYKARTEKDVCIRKMSTYGRWLSIASPSILTKHIIRNFKTGRPIKSVKPGQLHQIVLYDSEGSPLAIEHYSTLSPDGGLTKRSETTYFTDYGGCVWTAMFYERSGWIQDEHFKIVYDDMQRLKGFYQINAHDSQQVYAEEYDHSKADEGIIVCLFTDYTGQAVHTSKDIPIGFKGSPAIQWRYEMNVDGKGKITALTTYKNTEGEFVFNEHVDIKITG